MEYLSNGPIDLTYLNDYYRRELQEIFDKLTKPSVAIWDAKVKQMVYSIYSKESLEKLRISNILIDDLHTLQKTNKYKSIIMFIKSSMKMIDMAESVINKNFCDEYHLIFVPDCLSCHSEYIDGKGLQSKLKNIAKFRCYGVPLDNDLISLENPDFIMNMNDLPTLYELAKTIMIIQSIYGIIPKMSGQGEKVAELNKILKIMRNSSSEFTNTKEAKIHQMLVFDRRIDMLTPLLCQITYEGLLDELFKFASGFISIPVILLNKNGNIEDSELFQMNSSDSFYADARNTVIHECMKKIADFHKEVETEREKYMKAKKLEEMAEVTNNLKSFMLRDKSAQFHFALGMNLNKYTKRCDYTDFVTAQNNFISQIDIDKVHPIVEEYIIKKKDIDRVIQLICIQSICANGLKPKVLNWYKREIIRAYGLQYVTVLARLDKMNLLTVQQTSSMIPLGERTFETLLTILNLVPESEKMHLDVSNIYAGFIPIITRLVQYHSTLGWTNISKAFSLLPGPEIHVNETIDDLSRSNNYEKDSRKIVLVVYIGGVTFSEISTLRFLSQQEDSDTSYIILTTGIINNMSYIGSLSQTPDILNNPFAD